MQNAYQQYKEQSVSTMTQGEMLVVLYDEVVKRLIKATLAAAQDNYAVFDAEVGRAREIIHYFEQALDRKYPISAELARLYEYFGFQMSRSIAGHKVEYVEEILPMLSELRDTWREAERMTQSR